MNPQQPHTPHFSSPTEPSVDTQAQAGTVQAQTGPTAPAPYVPYYATPSDQNSTPQTHQVQPPYESSPATQQSVPQAQPQPTVYQSQQSYQPGDQFVSTQGAPYAYQQYPVQPSSPPNQQPGQSYPYQTPQQPANTQPSQSTQGVVTTNPPQADTEYDSSFSVDYLNEIAPKPAPAPINKFAVIGLIVGVLALAFGSLILINGSQPNYTTQAQTTLARIETLQTATKEQQSRLTESSLSSMNSTLTASLGSMHSELETAMEEAKIKTNLSGNAKETEKSYSESLTKTLDDAYLTGTLDRVYARQMSYELGILKSYLQKLKNASGNRKAISDYYTTNSKTIDAATKSFTEFTSTK